MPLLDHETYNEIIAILEPLTRTAENRSRLFNVAFTGINNRPYIDTDSNENNEVQKIVEDLVDFGMIGEQSSLWLLLEHILIFERIDNQTQARIKALEPHVNVADLTLGDYSGHQNTGQPISQQTTTDNNNSTADNKENGTTPPVNGSARQNDWSLFGIIGLVVAIFSCAIGLVTVPQINSALFPTATPTDTPLPTATPLEGVPFPDDVVGVVIADFVTLDNASVEGIVDRLETSMTQNDFAFIRVQHPIENREQAQNIAELYNATLTIWGKAAEGTGLEFIEISYETTPRGESFVETTVDGVYIENFLENYTMYFLEGMDSRYIMNFTIGQIYYFDEDYETARSLFDTSVDLLKEAVSRIEGTHEDDLKAAPLYFYRGTTYIHLDDYGNALVNLNNALDLDETDASAYTNLGIVYRNLGRYDDALAAYAHSIEMCQSDCYIEYNNRGVVYSSLGRYDDALADYNHALTLNENYAEAYANRGVLYRNMGRYDEAFADYDQALSLNENAINYTNRGVAYNYSGQYDEALADFERALELDENYAQAYLNRGSAYHQLGLYDEAIIEFTTALNLDATLSEAYYNRGLIYNELERYEEAIADFDQSIPMCSMDCHADYRQRGYAHQNLNNYKQAIADYTEAIALDENGDTYFYRGLAYYDLDQFDEAIADFSSTLQLIENDADAYYYRGLSYYKTGSYLHAIADFDLSIPLCEYGCHVEYFYRGNAHLTLEHFDEAIADYSSAIQLDENFASAYWGRGSGYYIMGIETYELAIADYRRYAEITGDFEPIMEELIAEMQAALAEQE